MKKILFWWFFSLFFFIWSAFPVLWGFISKICQFAQNVPPPFVNYALIKNKSNRQSSNLYLLTVNNHFYLRINDSSSYSLYIPHIFILWWPPSFCLFQRSRKLEHLSNSNFCCVLLILMKENDQGKMMNWVKKLGKLYF